MFFTNVSFWKVVKMVVYLFCLFLSSFSLRDWHLGAFSPELLRFLGAYKFHIAIENWACDDYITEKFWRPLLVGSVPIYFGSPTFAVRFTEIERRLC